LPEVGAIVRDSVAAISVGLVQAGDAGLTEFLDLDYSEDRDADVDLNLVMTGKGEFVEVQAGGEEATFSQAQLHRLLDLGKQGVAAVTALQRRALGRNWPLD
jgi:ribonuclease PH